MPDEAGDQSIEALRKMQESIRACEECELRKRGGIPIPGCGHPLAKVFIVGIAPTKDVLQAGTPLLVGDVGRRLQCWLEYAGLSPDFVYFTNIIKCMPLDPKGAPLFPSFSFDDRWAQSCRHWLDSELNCVSAKIVVLLGQQALKWVLDYDSVARFQREKQGDKVHDKYWFALNHPSFSARVGEWIRDEKTREAADAVRELLGQL